MEKRIVELLGIVFRMLLRYWARDSEILNENLLDVEQFAQQCGLSLWESKKFNRTIDDFVDILAEKFIKDVGTDIKDEERKKAIIRQIQNDFKQVGVSEKKIILELSNSDDLRNAIMMQSQEERKIWKDSEVGVYTNCVKYISKAGIDFIYKLPSFTPEALKVVIKRHDEYNRQLSNILNEIRNMTKITNNMDVVYSEYNSIYREKLVEKYSKVELFGAGLKDRKIRRYDISSSYVELNCISNGEYEEEIRLSQVFSYSNVIWVKGEAGSGKTTFLQWVAVCAAKNNYKIIKNIWSAIPIVIELRNINWPLNLQDVVNNITEPYGSSMPTGWLSEILMKNTAIILFDGLDEIDQNMRDATYNFIENIVIKYPNIKVLLTSRNSVKDCICCNSISYEIVPMKIDNIKVFIMYWHNSVLRRDALENDENINKLQQNLIEKIRDIQALKSLARNPLLCAMICALNYVNNEQLPNDKMELYDKCCEMLIEARDYQRNISSRNYANIPKLDYSSKRKILEELAFWMMIGGVSSERKSNVKDFLKHLLRDTNIFLNKKENYSIETLLNFFIERSGIIREPEEGIINFIHKTFMEYLTVKAVCRSCAWNILVKEALNVNWRETIVMCFREMGKENVEWVLNQLVGLGKEKNDRRYFFLASLGASNAIFLSNNIKEEIDVQIRKMIPPLYNEITEIGQAGTYLLPFLKDSSIYSNNEKERCLCLLNYLETEEIIPDIISYISGNGSDNIKKIAIEMLLGIKKIALDEYDVCGQLLNIIKISIKDTSLTTYENMLYLLDVNGVELQDTEVLKKIKNLLIVCGFQQERLYVKGFTIFDKMKYCENMTVVGDIKNLNFLGQFEYLTELKIDTSNDFSKLIKKLRFFCKLISIKKLYIGAIQLNNICYNYFDNMSNIESLEIHCHYNCLEIDFDSFKNFHMLKKIVLDVDFYLKEKLKIQIPILKKRNNNLEIDLL